MDKYIDGYIYGYIYGYIRRVVPRASVNNTSSSIGSSESGVTLHALGEQRAVMVYLHIIYVVIFYCLWRMALPRRCI